MLRGNAPHPATSDLMLLAIFGAVGSAIAGVAGTGFWIIAIYIVWAAGLFPLLKMLYKPISVCFELCVSSSKFRLPLRFTFLPACPFHVATVHRVQ